MTINPLNTSASVVLDANGNGVVKISANIGQRITVAVAAVRTSTAVLNPTCLIYLGGQPIDANFVDGTYTGNQDSTDRTAGLPITAGSSIWAVWAGGDVGATATLSIIGTLETGYKS